MDAKDWSLHRIAKQQHGVITYEQAESVGLKHDAVRWRLEQGEWVRVLTGVARLYWADDTVMSRCWAACLWAGRLGDHRASDYALSHETAARLLGLDVASDLIHLTSDRGRHGRRTWLSVHRSGVKLKTLALDGLRLTSPARTIVDLASSMVEGDFAPMLDSALQQRVVSHSSLRAELSRRDPRGRSEMLSKHLRPLVRV